jgi:hypothetical protein
MKKRSLFYFFEDPIYIPNVFIGGLATTLPTAASFLARIFTVPGNPNIQPSNIHRYTIVGNDIELYIDVDYWGGSAGFRFAALTYYLDLGKMVGSSNSTFQQTGAKRVELQQLDNPGSLLFYRNSIALADVILPNIITVGYNEFLRLCSKLRIVYMPRCTQLGSHVGYTSCYVSTNRALIVHYANPFLQTNNGGGLDGDLQYLIDGGGEVRWVTNFNGPEAIDDLIVTSNNGTSLELSWTAPVSSTNVIDFYEVYIGKKKIQMETGTTTILSGLIPGASYKIHVVTADYLYNRSYSNIIEVTTI